MPGHKMKVVAIIQARMGSTRLPGKVLKEIAGKTLIEHVIGRVKHSKIVDEVIVATSNTSKDSELSDFLQNKNVKIWRGPEEDVLRRFHYAARFFHADHIVRICGDQPLVDPLAIDLTMEQHLSDNNDFTNSKDENGWPDGTGCEIISFAALQKAQESSTDKYEREHIKPFFLNHPNEFKLGKVSAPPQLRDLDLHLAIDTEEDLASIRKIFEKYNENLISLEQIASDKKDANSNTKKRIRASFIVNFKNMMKEATNITTLGLAKEMQSRGHEITIISTEGKRGNEYEADGIKVIEAGCSGKKKWWDPRFIHSQLFGPRSVLKDQKMDILHHFSSSPLLSIRAIMASYGRQLKTIHTMKSLPLKSGIGITSHLNRFDAITVPTFEYKKILEEKGAKDVRVVRSNIDTKKFRPLNKEELRKKYDCMNKKIIFYYGAMRKEKGIHNLVQAMIKILEKNPNILLIIASRANTALRPGEIIRREIAEDIGVNKLQLNANVKIIVEDIDVVEYLNIANVLVLAYPTLKGTEGNPSCILEAMACKTPIVTSDLPEIREILTHQEDALLTIPGDIDDLANNVNKILNNPHLAEELSNKSFQKAKDFDVKKIADDFLEIYEEVMKHPEFTEPLNFL